MKKAVLLLNMGGPNNLDEVEMFLNNMFNDKRIISAPKPIRMLIAKLITYKRKNQSKKNYLASLKKKKTIIFPIAFTIDNSETEFELEIEYREVAEKLGFEIYRVAKAPNDHPAFVDCLVNIYQQMKEA